ncbi:hypothetical protein [Nocardioides sp. NPDC006273]|uniref:hypothetical protein n=1 Tax=Nocardioides sp. NPDC006273 TaxID=3155598 RepID=UPI0033B56E01
MRTSRSIAIATLATAISVVLAACGTDEEPEAKPTSETSAAEASPGAAGPSVPAGWRAASVEIAQFHVPADWAIEPGGKQILSLVAPENEIGLSPGAGHVSADVYTTDDEIQAELDGLAKLAHEQFKADSSLTKLERLPNETINGSLFYHFRAESEFTWEDHYATLVPDAGMQVAVTWKFNKSDIDHKGADALIEPIMATYEVL